MDKKHRKNPPKKENLLGSFFAACHLQWHCRFLFRLDNW